MKSLLISTALLGAGIGMLLMVIDRWMKGEHNNPPGYPNIYHTVQFLASGALIGAGLAAPFGQLRLGAYVGFIVEIGYTLGHHLLAVGSARAFSNPMFVEIFAPTLAVLFLAVFAISRRLWLYWQNKTSRTA